MSMTMLIARLATCATAVLAAGANMPDGAETASGYDAEIRSRIGVSVYSIQDVEIPNAGRPRLVAVELDGTPVRLVLQPHSVRAAGFRVRVGDATGGLYEVPAPPATTYQGYVEGMPDSRVYASIVRGRLTASVMVGDSEHAMFAIQPVGSRTPGDRPSAHVVYRVSDAQPPEGGCALVDADGLRVDESLARVGLGGVATVTNVQVCDIACDADYEYYQLNNASVDDTVADIEAVILGVAEVYERDLRISYAVSEVIVRIDEADPYTESVPEALLIQFRDHWRADHEDVARDVAHLFTGRDLAGTPVGIAFGEPGICSTWSGYSISQSRYSDQWPVRVTLTAHELGHNFDAGHCDWGDWWCRIMCTTNGGCAGRNSFGPESVDQISAFAATCDCMASGVADLPSTPLPFYDGFDYAWDLDPAMWTAVDGAYPSQTGGIEPSPTRSAMVNEYDTFRSLPMVVARPVTISYWTNHKGVEQTSGAYGKSLKVEFFNSSTWRWQTLETVTSDGVDTSDFTPHTHRLPAEGVGDHFALRFAGYGSFAEFNDKWFIDDVRVTPVYPAGDVDADDAITLADLSAFVHCLGGPDVVAPPDGCDALQFARADLDDGDDDVDLHDYAGFQRLFGSAAVCGDGWISTGEWCDDGEATAYCNDDCSLAICGDGKVNEAAGEACDDAGASALCDPDCTAAECGDGYVNEAANEACDDEGESYSCDADCTPAGCGDGTTNTTRGEECDDGEETADCDANCSLAVCGDHYVNAAAEEQCDDGHETAECNADCTWSSCGDGVHNEAAGEECDDGNTVGGDGCSAMCTLGEPLPTCVIDFDTTCLPDVPECGVTMVDGYGMCEEATFGCVHTPPNRLLLDDWGGMVELAFEGDVYTLSLAIWGEWGGGEELVTAGGPGYSRAWIEFRDAQGELVEYAESNICGWDSPEPLTFAFDRPVRSTLIILEMPPVWLDTIEINP